MANPASEQQEEDIEVTNHTEKKSGRLILSLLGDKVAVSAQFLLQTPAGEEGCMEMRATCTVSAAQANASPDGSL